MPPDADKLRQRGGSKPLAAADVPAEQLRSTAVINGSASASGEERLRSLGSLEPHEVCIDGAVYDLRGFHHPGGDSIHLFGGNDVTVQYNMIHAYHTDKHLEKMRRVGRVADYASE